jgi:hypothetical protein
MSAPEDLVGQTLGRWKLEKRLGDGPMGPVYMGLSAGGTGCAVHVVRPELIQAPERRGKLLRDAHTFQKAPGRCRSW